MAAAKTHLPGLGVPVHSKALNGLDSLLSIVQMPAGIPVGTLAIGRAGAVNAALLAAVKSLNLGPADVKLNVGESVQIGRLRVKTDEGALMLPQFYKGRDGRPAFAVDSLASSALAPGKRNRSPALPKISERAAVGAGRPSLVSMARSCLMVADTLVPVGR
jgi:hypothetical protein